jgi:hypothetical protein
MPRMRKGLRVTKNHSCVVTDTKPQWLAEKERNAYRFLTGPVDTFVRAGCFCPYDGELVHICPYEPR